MADWRAQPQIPLPPLDTSEQAWAALWDHLGSLRPDEKAQLANMMSIDCERLARAGIAVTEPTASEERIRYLLAVRRYGLEFAAVLLGSSSC